METLQSKVKQNPTRTFMVAQVLLLGVAYFIYSLNRVSFPVGLHAIGETFKFTGIQTATLGTIFLLGQAIIDIPAGYISDRLSRRALYFGSVLGIGILTTAFTYLTVNFVTAVTWRVLFGMVEGVFNICLFGLVGTWFPERRGFFNNLLGVFNAMGAVFGPSIFGLLIQTTGSWQLPMLIYSATAWVWAFVLLFGFRVNEKDFPSLAEQKRRIPRGEGFGTVFVKLIKNGKLWSALCIFMLNMLPEWGFAGLGAYMLMTVKHIDVATVGLIMSAFGLGQVASPLFGHWSDRFGRKPVTITLASIGVVALYFLLLSSITTHWLLIVFSFIAGIGILTIYFMGYTLAQDAVNPEYIGFATGMTGGFGYLIGAFSGFLFGTVTQSLGYRAAVVLLFVVPEILVILAVTFLVKNKSKQIDVANSGC